MKNLLFFAFILLLSNSLSAQSDEIREAWDKAKDLCNENHYVEAKPYLQLVYTEMPRALCCYWLGLAYDIEEKRDSAIFYYEQCIENSKKPQLAALDNIIRCHLRKLDFDKAYSTAWGAVTKYPGSKLFLEEYKAVCKWAYFIKHMDFDADYLSNTKLHKEYEIKTITEQHLILTNIRNQDGQHLHVGNRQYKGNFEIWQCRYNNSKEQIEVKFHLEDHDLDRQLDKQHEKAKNVYNNKEEKIHIRLGALLTLTPLSDKQMLDLMGSDKEEVRLCTCSEVLSTTSKKVKKACKNDDSENIKAMCEKLEAFE